MKIALFDHVRKFTNELIDHWKSQGHEVKIDRYLDPGLVHWADVCFFEFCDISIQRASDNGDSFWKDNPQPSDKNIVVRMHDIDAWVGQHKGVQWPWVNHLVFVADHIREKVLKDIEVPTTLQVHTIKHGINLDAFTYKERGKGKKIAWIGNCNEAKNVPLALQVLAENPEYELHVVGGQLNKWKLAYVQDFVKRNNLKFFHQEHVENINDFLEDKDFLLLTSMKEAFSFVVGEAMAKGIKPIIHHFYGAENIWPKEYLWNKASEVDKHLKGNYNSLKYRDYIKENYNLTDMLKKYDKII